MDGAVELLPWGLWGAAGRIGQQQGAVGGAGQRRGAVSGAGQRRGAVGGLPSSGGQLFHGKDDGRAGRALHGAVSGGRGDGAVHRLQRGNRGGGERERGHRECFQRPDAGGEGERRDRLCGGVGRHRAVRGCRKSRDRDDGAAVGGHLYRRDYKLVVDWGRRCAHCPDRPRGGVRHQGGF